MTYCSTNVEDCQVITTQLHEGKMIYAGRKDKKSPENERHVTKRSST